MNAKPSRARKVLRVFLISSLISLILGGIASYLLYRDYPSLRDKARAEELEFWKKSDQLTEEDRSALVNHAVRTNKLPHVLPWWEYDRDMCSANVVKYISMFTGVKFFHTSAWEFRTLRPHPCKDCVANSRKLTTLFDVTEEFDVAGNLAAGRKEELVKQVTSLPFEDDKLYVIGMLWEKTAWWKKIRAANRDVNSHVVLYTHGKVIHFFHLGDEDPLRMETLQDVFARGDMKPVWIAEVHEKSRATAPDWILKSTEYRFVKTDRELGFDQNIWPWESLKRFLRFPAEPDFVPESWLDFTRSMDTFIEKTILMRYRNGFDPYPTAFREVKK